MGRSGKGNHRDSAVVTLAAFRKTVERYLKSTFTHGREPLDLGILLEIERDCEMTAIAD